MKLSEHYNGIIKNLTYGGFGFLTIIALIFLLYFNSVHIAPSTAALPVRRLFIEGVMVMLAIFMMDKKALSIFVLLLIMSLFHWELSHNIVWNIATIPLIVYSSHKKIITSRDLAFLMKGTVLILLAFVLLNEANGYKVELFKNAGPFPSSLHLAYVLVTLSLLIFIEKSPTAHIFLLIIFCMAVLNGSRASLLFAGILFFLSLGKLQFKLKIIYTLIAILFVLAFSIRNIGYELGNDDVRLSGYFNYLENLSVTNFFFGEGRANYGSIGFRIMGKENVLITESSLIMLLYCHGIIISLLLVKPIFVNLYKTATLSMYNVVPVSLLFGLFLLVPFFDAIGIGVLNAFFLNQMFLNSREMLSE